MKRRILSMILTLVMVLSMLPATALTAWAAEDDIMPQADDDEVAPPADEEAIFDGEGTEDSPDQTADEVVPLANSAFGEGDGDGTKEDPYKISTAEQLDAVKNDLTAHYELVTDIHLEDSDYADNWTPIGNSTTSFTGTFDGKGNEITGLYVTGTTYRGLFGYVGSGGTVENVTVSGTVSGSTLVGGVAARNAGTIKNCYNDCDVTGKTTSTSTQGVGGVVGYNTGTIENCHNTGTVVNDGTSGYTGGVVGYNSGTVTDCDNTKAVTGKKNTGGVVGYVDGGTVAGCHNKGEVTGSSDNTGGVAGYVNSYSTVENCYNTGKVAGTADKIGRAHV